MPAFIRHFRDDMLIFHCLMPGPHFSRLMSCPYSWNSRRSSAAISWLRSLHFGFGLRQMPSLLLQVAAYFDIESICLSDFDDSRDETFLPLSFRLPFITHFSFLWGRLYES